MQWLANWFNKVELEPRLAQRLLAWQALPEAPTDARLDETRYVVVDVESTGLDLRKDRLIAIGAVAVEGGKVNLEDSFEIVLRQDESSDRDNILIHGIGGQAQRTGIDPQEALLAFLEYLGKAPLLAFHVAFDETMIRRAMREYLRLEFKRPWLDLAYVMPALMPQFARRYRALDDWAGHFKIANFARHNALADALVTAQLFLAALPLAFAGESGLYRNLRDLEKAQRWIGWSS
jgi:DNA polymerase-3 subunit epsilon